MTEIEKMLESIGLKKQYCGWIDMGDLDCQPQYVRCNSVAEWNDLVFASRFGETEKDPEQKYPPFTAEKQLKIIQLLSKIRGDIQLCYSDNQYIFVVNFESVKCQWANKYHDKLDEALADMVNVLWQSLTNQEKEEIRKILNDTKFCNKYNKPRNHD